MTNATQLRNAIDLIPAEHELVVATDPGRPTATILVRDPKTGLLYSPFDAPLEHVSFNASADPWGIPMLSREAAVVEGAPRFAELVVGATVAGERFSGNTMAVLHDDQAASDILRMQVRGVADQVAKMAGEHYENLSTAQAEASR